MAKIDNRSKEAKAAQKATEQLPNDTFVSDEDNATNSEYATQTAKIAPVVAQQEQSISSEDVKALLNTVKALQDEVGALKEASGDKANMFAKAREIYQ